jgi:hypothetical protein
MRFLATALVISGTLLGCASTRTDVETPLVPWKERINREIPVGTDAAAAKEWFERQGLETHRDFLKPSNDMEILLGDVPAHEWYCDKWVLRVLAKVSPDGKVASYDFGAVGICM